MKLKPRLFRKPRRSHWSMRGCVGRWLLNEGSGNTVFDLSGNGYDSKVTDGNLIWTSARFGSGLDNTGSARIWLDTIANYPSLYTDRITISVWIKLTGDISVLGHIYGSAYNVGAWLAFDSAERIGFDTKAVDKDSDSWRAVSSALTIGQWYHVTATYDGRYKSVYLDGVLVATKDTGAKAGLLDWSTNTLIIGLGEGGSWRFNGDFDNISVYNRVLSASEIALLYREPFIMFEEEM